jgi:hypothetical protein
MTRARAIRWLPLLFLMLLVAAGAFGDVPAPKPYSPNEFPRWAADVWRAEVVAVGSFPFTLFATLEVYDTVRYVSNGLNPAYAPWPLGSGSAVSYSPAETGWLAVSAVSLSAVIAAIDFLIGRLNAKPPLD